MKRKWKIVLILSLIGNLCIFYVAYKALEYRAHINHFLDKYTHVTAEFSERSVFEQDNARLKGSPPAGNRVVFFGTQVIKKWDLKRYFENYEPVNRGVAGQRASGFLLRFKPDVIELEPMAVLIELSSYNFRPENTVKELEDYVSLIAQLSRVNGIEPILTTVIPPAVDVEVEGHGDYSVHDSLKVYNDWIRTYCTDNEYALADFYSILADSNGYLSGNLASNAVEPNEEGYGLLSEAVLKTLQNVKVTAGLSD
ncbi:MAG: GDSL-type esterase/lipase family protein [Candidatus Zixiibacteriota bacterium]